MRLDKSFTFAFVAALGLSLSACGGKTPPKVPEGTKVDTPATGGPGAVYGPGGQQYAVTDAPSSGEAATNRPKMNATAAQAYAAGMAAFQSGDLQGAKQQFTQATQADDKAYQAFYSLGVVKERLNEISGALSSYTKAVAIVPDYEPAIVGYAELLARTGKESEAESYLNGKLAKMPKSAAVPAAMAEVKSIQGDSGEAQKYARDALKKNPDYRPAMVTIARDHYRRRRLDLALYTLQAILDGFGTENPARDATNAQALLLRGLIYKEQGNRAGAMKDFQQAVSIRPDLVEARVQLAGYQLEAGNATEAAKLLEEGKTLGAATRAPRSSACCCSWGASGWRSSRASGTRSRPTPPVQRRRLRLPPPRAPPPRRSARSFRGGSRRRRKRGARRCSSTRRPGLGCPSAHGCTSRTGARSPGR